MNIEEELKSKSRGQLVDIADKLNIKVHHRAGPDTVVKLILQQPEAFIISALSADAAPANVTIGHSNTVEDVKAAIKQYMDLDGFTAEFPADGTWIFKRRGAEESGNMSIPLKVIKQRAEFVSKGRFALRAFGKESGFESVVAKGHNDLVLMG